MTSRLHLLPLALATLPGTACARYAWVNELDVPGYCTPAGRESPRMPGALVIDTAPPAAPAGELAGTLRRAAHGTPIYRGRVALRGAPVAAVHSDSVGQFVISGVPPGRYELAAMAVGYAPRRDSVTLGGTSGLRVRVELEPSALDGPCSGLAVIRVRKPWWKLW